MYALLLAGGKGTRLWPLSKSETPKQILSPLGEQDNLLEMTIKRIQNCTYENSKILLITVEDQKSLLEKYWLPFNLGEIIAEPIALNTAPAILLATKYLHSQNINPHEAIYVFPTDHYIRNLQLDNTLDLSEKILCFRIIPSRAETGYGYIQIQDDIEPRKVSSFKEKPTQELANKWYKAWLEDNIQSKSKDKYFWNSGIYGFSLNSLGNALKEIDLSLYNKWINLSYSEFLVEYSHLPNLPFDKLIAENANNLYSLPLPADSWRDIGVWESIHEALRNKPLDNIQLGKGNFIPTSTTNSCLISSDKNINIACAGVNNLAIIIAENNILIADKNDPAAIQELISKLQKEYPNLL